MLIRLCIFFISSVCVGLPALLCALHFLHRHRKIRGRISVFILVLLGSDIMQMFLNVFTLTRTFKDHTLYFEFFAISPLSFSGFLLHQLVALEGVLTLKYPQFSAHIFSLRYYLITCILVIVFFFLNMLTFSNNSHVNEFILSFSLGTTLAPLSLLAVTFSVTCVAPPTPVIGNTRSVFAVAMVSFVILYSPFMLISCLHFIIQVPESWFEMSVCLLSLRVISDPVLCVLVCRENLRDVQTPKTHKQLNADRMAIINVNSRLSKTAA